MEHKATVEHVDGECVDVVMTVREACAGCRARHVCGAGDGTQKRITVHTADARYYTPGEQVVVSVSRQMGVKAVTVAYIYPFFLMLATLLVLNGMCVGELVAGLSALGVLVPYYLVVYLLRRRIEKEIVFKLRKE